MMRDAQARTIYLKDYKPPAFTIEKTDLHFELYEDHALVKATLLIHLYVSPGGGDADSQDTLILHGQDLVLEKLSLNTHELSEQDYIVNSDSLTIPLLHDLLKGNAENFTLTCHTRIEPQANTALEGLYKSGSMFCTQCEAEGFRRITYYLDRPDVMSVFTTTIVADRGKYPVLLSNGNKMEEGVDSENPERHWVTWHDPFKKPSYLFALVAGNLVKMEDNFLTTSQRNITLQIFVEEKDLDKCDHAMRSLKNAMKWDEEVYGREYDLDIFMIVAVDTFNMGAMENKGLNIFNTSCVLANPKTTTDAAFQRVEAVVAHEYFHNWSGNRVTCRDWFQLSLKEGFTVFRDSEFSADMGSRAVKRIEDVALLRTAQFAEDAGPMSHPIRPDSYMEISNFYTLTVYEKGAEVVRMISHILGPDKFRAGSDLYFNRHDGQAVTTEDFVKAMEDASGVDLGLFRNWYTQSGTPVVEVTSVFDAQAQTYQLKINQSCPPTPGQAKKNPFHIPLRMGLIDKSGSELPLQLEASGSASQTTDLVLDVTEPEATFTFHGIESEPVPSLLRGFSAPIRLSYSYTPEQLYFLMVHDTDGFNRWNASQQLAVTIIDELILQRTAEQQFELPEILVRAFKGVLQSSLDDPQLDKAMVAQLLTLPAEGYLIEIAECADVEAIHEVREFLNNALAQNLAELFFAVYQVNSGQEEFSITAGAVAKRSLKNLCLAYLTRTSNESYLEHCNEQFAQADNMTDQHAALRLLVNCPDITEESKQSSLDAFYQQWSHEPLVVDQWFSIQATCTLTGTLEKVKNLMKHVDFKFQNPNKVRSLIGAFCGQNHINFHNSDGSGYEFLAEQIMQLDTLNPQIASRLLAPLTRWEKYDPSRQKLMIKQLGRVRAKEDLSKDVFEVVEKSLADT